MEKIATTNSSRRNFVSAAVKAALGAYALSAIAPANIWAAPRVAPGSKIRLGFQTYLWGKDWDVPTIIANLTKADLKYVELRTSDKYAHGLEITLTPAQRQEYRKRFADSPVKIISVASAAQMDEEDEVKFRTAIDTVKKHILLAKDVDAPSVRVFPNKWHPGVPPEKTIARIAQALNEVGAYAADNGILIGLEEHGPVGTLPVLRQILDQVPQRSVGIKLNCEKRALEGEGFEANFNLIKHRLSNTMHLKNVKDTTFPYQLMVDLLVKADWDGVACFEYTHEVPDKVAALIEHRQIWEGMVAKAMKTNKSASGKAG
jgi:sugar phosphate isomerase/epimerase